MKKTSFNLLPGPVTVTRSGVGVVPAPKGAVLYQKEQLRKMELTYYRNDKSGINAPQKWRELKT